MAYRNVPAIEIENATIFKRNFSGIPNEMNKEGERNFCVFIDDDELAQQMAADGWNIKILKPRNDEEVARYYLPVAIGWNHPSKKPHVVQIKRRTQVELDESMIHTLDGVEIVNVDLMINAKFYTDRYTGEERIKAWVKELWVTISESRFANKYAQREAPEEEPW